MLTLTEAVSICNKLLCGQTVAATQGKKLMSIVRQLGISPHLPLHEMRDRLVDLQHA